MLSISFRWDRSSPAGVRKKGFVVSVKEYDGDRN